MAYKAQQFQINGWVRNSYDASVVAMIQGTPDNVAAIIERAKHGPPNASVTAVAVSEGSGSYSAFVILPTD